MKSWTEWQQGLRTPLEKAFGYSLHELHNWKCSRSVIDAFLFHSAYWLKENNLEAWCPTEIPQNNGSQVTFLGSVIAERIYPATRQCFIIFKGEKKKKTGAATYDNSPLLCNNDGTNTTQKPVRWDCTTSEDHSLMLLLAQDNLKFCGELGANIAAVWSKP